MERRLAAILSADAVGYSRLMAEDEDSTARTMTAYREQLAALVREHRGRVVDAPGDNLLAELPTPTDALECALEIQRVVAARNESLAPERRMAFRIGVHLGELTAEAERVYGAAVNVAARLQALAEPGGICVSAAVREQVGTKLAVGWQDLGAQSLKNIPEPVQAYQIAVERERVRPAVPRIRLALAAAAVVAVVALTWLALRDRASDAAPLTSIAVLPFDDMSPGGDQKWLADGMAEELIEALSRIEELRVIARTSAFAQRGEDVATIGERLQVGAVVEGSLRRSGGQLRVTAQLIRTEDQSHLWSASYERGLDDVFRIQREIAREVAEAVRRELGLSGTRSWLIDSRYATPDVRAWELVRKAVDREQTWTEAGFRDEIALTLQALEIDPDYAQAHAQLGWGNYMLWSFGFAAVQENLVKARSAAERALEFEPTNGAAQNLLGHLSMQQGDWAGAEARIASALRDTPSHGPLREGLGIVLLATGRGDEAIPQLERAVALDPEQAAPRYWLGLVHLGKRDFAAAIAEFEKALTIPLARWILSYTHHLRGEDERAAEVLLKSAPPAEAAAWRRAFAERGYSAIARAALEHEIAASGAACTNDRPTAAWMLAVLGEPDRMFACLDESVGLGRAVYDVKVNPAYDPYRSDPRFAALLGRMNLEE